MFKFFNPIYPKEVKKIDYINRINNDIKNIIENAGGKLDKDGNLIKNGDINNEDYLNLLTLFHMQIPYDNLVIYGFDYNSADIYDMTKINEIIAKVPPVYKPVLISYFGIGVDRIPFNEVDTDKFWEAFSWVPKEDRSVLEKYYGERYTINGIERRTQKRFYSSSLYSSIYFVYIKNTFFRGLTPEEFEKDEKIMEEFNKLKAELKYKAITKKYEDLPTRERKLKPKNKTLLDKKKRAYMTMPNQKDTTYLYTCIHMLNGIKLTNECNTKYIFIEDLIKKYETEVSEKASILLKLLKAFNNAYGKDDIITLSKCIDSLYREDYMHITLEDYIKSLEGNPTLEIEEDEELFIEEEQQEKPILLNDLTKIGELSREAKLWRPIIIDSLRRIKKSKIKDFVNSEYTIIGIAKYEKDLILKSAAYELIYEDEEKYKEKLSYIINK